VTRPRAFVIGHPVAHSRSPLIHGHWLRSHGLPGSYERVDVAPKDLACFIGEIGAAGFCGGNVTLPHKESIVGLVDELTPEAARLGAVNTLSLRPDGRILGDNTDGQGFVAGLAQAVGREALARVRTALLLGAGGAARGIAAALIDAGVEHIVVANRTASRADAVQALGPGRIEPISWQAAYAASRNAGLLVNTTSLGMSGQPSLDIRLDGLPDDAIVGRHRLRAARDAVAGRGAGARTARRRWSRHVAASSRARVRALVRGQARGYRRIAPACRERSGRTALTFVLGLTGSIGMGKSATAAMFRSLNVPVHDADEAVHQLYRGDAAPLVEAAFPGVVVDGVVDRTRLRERVLGSEAGLKQLESIIHPLVRREEERFLAQCSAEGRPLAVLDVPLLFETGGEGRCDAVVVVSAPAEVQRQRVLARPGMSEETFRAILAKQMPDADKRARAQFIVDTAHGFAAAERQVRDIVQELAERPAPQTDPDRGPMPTETIREIVLDTETTGTDPAVGDRIVEIGAVELVDGMPTGRTWHRYCNPGRAMPADAFAVHGLSDAFLADKPPFAAVADELHAFLSGGRLVIHNAAFDVGFLNAEFARTGHGRLNLEEAVDTLALARRRNPGAAASLDALCSRYGIDNSRRTRHGALLDAELLAEVYIELLGGKQADLGFGAFDMPGEAGMGGLILAGYEGRIPPPRPALGEAALAAHAAFVATLGPKALWLEFSGP
jgi:DNA polymerase-3 subunit epsilon